MKCNDVLSLFFKQSANQNQIKKKKRVITRSQILDGLMGWCPKKLVAFCIKSRALACTCF